MDREKASKKLRKTLVKANIIALVPAIFVASENFWLGLTTFLTVFFTILGLVYSLGLKELSIKEIKEKLHN